MFKLLILILSLFALVLCVPQDDDDDLPRNRKFDDYKEVSWHNEHILRHVILEKRTELAEKLNKIYRFEKYPNKKDFSNINDFRFHSLEKKSSTDQSQPEICKYRANLTLLDRYADPALSLAVTLNVTIVVEDNRNFRDLRIFGLPGIETQDLPPFFGSEKDAPKDDDLPADRKFGNYKEVAWYNEDQLTRALEEKNAELFDKLAKIYPNQSIARTDEIKNNAVEKKSTIDNGNPPIHKYHANLSLFAPDNAGQLKQIVTFNVTIVVKDEGSGKYESLRIFVLSNSEKEKKEEDTVPPTVPTKDSPPRAEPEVSCSCWV